MKKKLLKVNPKAHPWSAERKRLHFLKWRGENSPSWRGGLTNNKEYQRQQRKKWNEANKERLAFLTKRSHEKDPKHTAQVKLLWQQNNRERIRLNNKTWREAHPEIVKIWKKRDIEKHRERVNFRNRQREHRERNAIGKFTFEQWLGLKARYEYKCVSCGKPEPEIKLTQDHIVPLIKSGLNIIENIQPLCSNCNSSKGVKIINYLLQYEKQKETA